MSTNLNFNDYLQTNNVPFCSTESILDKKNITRIINLFYVKNQILIGISINIVLLTVLLLLRQSLLNILLVIGITNVILTISFIIINLNIKNNIIKLNKDKKIYFYENFIVTFDKDNLNNSQNIILYKNISRVFVTKKFIFLKINKIYLVISNEDVLFNKPKIISSLIINNKRVTFTHNKKQGSKNSAYKSTRIAALILFIASILSVFIALIIYIIKVQKDIYDFVPLAQIRFTWVFFIPIAIPIATLIFGIRYHFRGGTTKDIIVGAITTVILLSCGSLSFIFDRGYNHDESIISSITEYQIFLFPDDYLIINEYYNDLQVSYIKITGTEGVEKFEYNIVTSPHWKKVENMPSNLKEVFSEFKDSFDYYCYYEDDDYNKHHKDRYIMAFYDFDQKLVQVFCIRIE